MTLIQRRLLAHFTWSLTLRLLAATESQRVHLADFILQIFSASNNSGRSEVGRLIEHVESHKARVTPCTIPSVFQVGASRREKLE